MWGMERPDSDVDIFICYTMSKTEFLIGTTPKNTCYKIDNDDIQKHEIYNVVNQLRKMNINYIWYLTSPKILKTCSWHKKLVKVFENNPAKSIMYSIRGLVTDNMKRNPNPTQKKMNMWLRTIWLGINYLREQKIMYRPAVAESIHDVNDSLKILIHEFKNSILPEYPSSQPYDMYLYKIREALVNGKM